MRIGVLCVEVSARVPWIWAASLGLGHFEMFGGLAEGAEPG